MRLDSGHDPILKSFREGRSFTSAWLKHGERMTWNQRIGFAIISFLNLSAGVFIGTKALAMMFAGDLFSANTLMRLVGMIVGLFFVVLGVPGLRNVLRF
jgi:hypothetical protein